MTGAAARLWAGDALRRMPGWLRAIGLILAVGTLVEFLPIDLAVVAVSVAALHVSIGIGIVWQRLRRRNGRGVAHSG